MRELRERLLDAWNEVVDIIPNVLLFLVILIIGLIVSKILERVVHAILTRLGINRHFQRTAQRAMSGPSSTRGPTTSRNTATASQVGTNVIDILDRVVYWLGVLFTLYFAFGVFGDNPFSDLLQSVVSFIPKAIVAVFLFVIAAGIANVVRNLTGESLRGTRYGPTVANAVGLFILVLGVIAALAQVGIALPVLLPLLYFVLLTIAGIAIVGVGGALVTTLRPYMEDVVDSLREEFMQPGGEETPPVPEVEPPTEEMPPPVVDNTLPEEPPVVDNTLPEPPPVVDNTLPTPPPVVDNTLPTPEPPEEETPPPPVPTQLPA